MVRMRIITVTTVAVFILAAAAAYAQMPDDRPQRGGEFTEDAKMHERLFDDLGLSAEQQKQLQENKNRQREQSKALFEEMKQNMDLIHGELQKPKLDMKKIYQLNDGLKKVQARMLDNRLNGILEVRKILTPEQFKEFDSKIKTMVSKRRAGGRHDGPPPEAGCFQGQE